MEPQEAFSTRELNEARNRTHHSVVSFMDDLIPSAKVAVSAAVSRTHGVLAPEGRNRVLVGFGGTGEAVAFSSCNEETRATPTTTERTPISSNVTQEQ